MKIFRRFPHPAQSTQTVQSSPQTDYHATVDLISRMRKNVLRIATELDKELDIRRERERDGTHIL